MNRTFLFAVKMLILILLTQNCGTTNDDDSTPMPLSVEEMIAGPHSIQVRRISWGAGSPNDTTFAAIFTIEPFGRYIKTDCHVIALTLQCNSKEEISPQVIRYGCKSDLGAWVDYHMATDSIFGFANNGSPAGGINTYFEGKIDR